MWEQRDLEVICMQVIFFKSKKKKEREVWRLQGKTMHSDLQEEKKEKEGQGRLRGSMKNFYLPSKSNN